MDFRNMGWVEDLSSLQQGECYAKEMVAAGTICLRKPHKPLLKLSSM
jgi:hypothetical protein